MERHRRSNDICIVRASVEEFLNGRVERRRDVQVRVHVGQRLEDEPSLGESGMRQGEIRSVSHRRSHNEEINVQNAWSPAASFLFRRAAFGLFHLLRKEQQVLRAVRSRESNDGIEKIGLLVAGQRVGLRLIHGRHGADRHGVVPRQAVDRGLQMTKPLSAIGPESEISRRHRRDRQECDNADESSKKADGRIESTHGWIPPARSRLARIRPAP